MSVISASLTKVASSSTVMPGGTTTYTITLKNTGTVAAGPLILTDNVPFGMTITAFAQTSGPSFTLTHTTITATATGSLNPNESAVFQLIVLVSPTLVCGRVLINTARVTFDAIQLATAPTSVRVINSPTITKTAMPSVVTAGSEVVFNIFVTVCDNLSFPGSTVTDVLPPGVTFISGSSSTGAVPIPSGNIVTFSNVTLIPGINTFTILALVNSNTPPGTLINTATVTDPTTGLTSTATATITVISSSALTVTKIGPPCVSVCDKIVYTIVVTNTGPSDVTDLVLEESICSNEDNLLKICPSNFIQISGPSFSGSISMPLKISIGSFPVGSVAIFQFTVCAPEKEGCVINSTKATASSTLASTSVTAAQVLTKVVKSKCRKSKDIKSSLKSKNSKSKVT